MQNLINNKQLLTAKKASEEKWDIAIIGAGMGGASIAYALTRSGHKVLLIEKGESSFTSSNSISVETSDPKERIQNGKWPTQLNGVVDGEKLQMWPALGCGLGGSTLLYAASLHRFRQDDFNLRVLPNGEKVQWPCTYTELKPYYEKAEKLFTVNGTLDPLDNDIDQALPTPPRTSERDEHFYNQFKDSGLHPFKLHSAVRYIDDCEECFGKICLKKCKRDANNSLITPALETGHLFISANTNVIKINSTSNSAESISVTQNKVEHLIESNIIVLAAGALFTPSILLNSVNPDWPKGLGNNNDMVGRNLMFHADNFIAFWPQKKNLSIKGSTKSINCRDFYVHNGEKYGDFYSTGLVANYGNILYSIRSLFDQSIFKKIPLIRQLLRIPAFLASKIFGEAAIFTTLIEDYAYHENRVVLDKGSPSGIRFEYTIHSELRNRCRTYKKLIRKKLSKLRSYPLWKEANLNFGHPCGTCRAGNDPEISVVDTNCKVHGIDNLYIADSSIMPTSGGTNPSLTIAANALRVADEIHKRLN